MLYEESKDSVDLFSETLNKSFFLRPRTVCDKRGELYIGDNGLYFVL
jgi:hypothetical protein